MKAVTANSENAELNAARQLLRWCIETGADEVIGDVPVNRFVPTKRQIASRASSEQPLPSAAARLTETRFLKDSLGKALEAAKSTARSAESLSELREALERFPHCDLRDASKKTVFSDGNPEAYVMIVGEAPGSEEARKGVPFVGSAGRLLDLMFSKIGLNRNSKEAKSSLYLANILPWRPPGNRDPKPDEVTLMRPFLERHIELASPRLLVAMGNFPCSALLDQTGITKLRGTWRESLGIPVMPTYHPAYLLRRPIGKRESWQDLLAIRHRLEEMQ